MTVQSGFFMMEMFLKNRDFQEKYSIFTSFLNVNGFLENHFGQRSRADYEGTSTDKMSKKTLRNGGIRTKQTNPEILNRIQSKAKKLEHFKI